ncbi:MAG TPA: terminase small subunit [Candidatus Angelobacter sp.]|jgi:phage terminase small subunit|nr:terminase small subunit [Candidatus Angelobacter sp.]
MPRRNPDATGILEEKMLKFIAAWQGNATAAARAAGYRNPQVEGCKLMKKPVIRNEIRRKQKAMSEESGKRLGAQLKFDRSQVLNRLWEISSIPPGKTNNNLFAQVKAAEALASVFDAELKQIAEILPHLHGKTPEELLYWVRHGQFPSGPGDLQGEL